MRTCTISICLLILVAADVHAQQQPKITPCEVAEADPPASSASTTSEPPPLVKELNASYEARKWGDLDRQLQAIIGQLGGFKCPKAGSIVPTPGANFVFTWRTGTGVPRTYVYHDTIARRPRAYIPADAPAAEWFDVLVGETRLDTHRLAAQWVASAALPSGTELSAWLEKILAGASGAIAIVGGLYPVRQVKVQMMAPRTRTPQDYQLYVAVSHLWTDVVPAKLALTTTAQVPIGNVEESAKKWKAATTEAFGTSATTAPLIDDYFNSVGKLDCQALTPTECVQNAAKEINTVWAVSTCRSDAACAEVTVSARSWASGLAGAGAENRQATLTAEKPKHLAVGAFTALVNYPDSVSNGETVRVKVGGDSKLSLDAFPRFATGFVAAWALRPHEPDFWGLANVGPYAGIVITPNIGMTFGAQWRFWRQMGFAAGAMTVWHPTGKAGDTLSASTPLKTKALTALTFGMTFTLDAR